MEPRKTHNTKGEIEQALSPVDGALSASEARYRKLFETTRDGILIIDAKTGYIIDANPFMVDMLGYTRGDFIGKAVWSFGPFKDIRANKSAFQDLMRNGYIRYENLPLETKGGRIIEVEFICNVYQVDDKRTIQCNVRDISKRKQAEKASLIIESQLSQAQKMAAVATLAGGVAHQFNNALTILTGALSILETEDDYQEAGKYMLLMKNAAGKMSRLTSQLLAYARGGKYSLESMSLSDLVLSGMPLLNSAFKPSITVETDLPSDLPQIRADRDQMQMALHAILANASEAIETDGVIRITCRKEAMTDERVKNFAGLRPGTYIRLTIADNGKGMDAKTQDRVFEPFFTTHFPGRGLAMAAVYGIVKNHDGWISIESEVNHGTTVSIYLPAFDIPEESTLFAELPMQKSQQGASF